MPPFVSGFVKAGANRKRAPEPRRSGHLVSHSPSEPSMMIRKSILLAALVTLAPAVLLAADPAATTPPAGRPHGQGQWFSRLDTNHDGAISKDEATAAAQARVQKMFDRLDANHDGLITQEEMRAAAQA